MRSSTDLSKLINSPPCYWRISTKIHDCDCSSRPTLYWIHCQFASAVYTAPFNKGYPWVGHWSVVMYDLPITT